MLISLDININIESSKGINSHSETSYQSKSSINFFPPDSPAEPARIYDQSSARVRILKLLRHLTILAHGGEFTLAGTDSVINRDDRVTIGGTSFENLRERIRLAICFPPKTETAKRHATRPIGAAYRQANRNF